MILVVKHYAVNSSLVSVNPLMQYFFWTATSIVCYRWHENRPHRQMWGKGTILILSLQNGSQLESWGFYISSKMLLLWNSAILHLFEDLTLRRLPNHLFMSDGVKLCSVIASKQVIFIWLSWEVLDCNHAKQFQHPQNLYFTNLYTQLQLLPFC